MSVRPILAALAGLLIVPAVATAQEFEGSITYQMEGLGQSARIVHHVKGRNARMEFNADGQTMAMITDFDGSKMIMLMPARKQWMDMKAVQEQMAGMMGEMRNAAAEAAAADPSEFDIRATGQMETIAGHECEHFVYNTGEGEVDVCAAKGMGWYFGSGGMSGGMGGMMGRASNEGASVPGMSNAQVEKWKAMYADGFFPLKVVSMSPSGSVTMVVTSIEKKSLDASLFAPPSDYTEMKMPRGGH
ncbi:MAG: DUF4412 domain-containing protein [Longimicrobiales bacterium]